MKVKVIQPMPPKGKLFDLKKKESKLKSATTYDASNDYAVIISGGGDNENNWVRYWNDCSAMYSALVNVYNYSPSHIYVIIADGTSSGNDRVLSAYQDVYGYWHYIRDSSPLDLDGNGTNDINYSATKSNISTVFNTLSGILSSDDHLFVFTTDHGGQESGDDVYMYLWGDEMRDDEFATELNKVNAGKITVLMGQCNSGGFVNDLSGNGRIISTACTADELSWSLANGTYDEYLYHWISAVVGETPEGTTVDADDNNDGWVSMREAFEYANANDNAHINGVYWQGVIYFETPQYNSTPADLGCFVRLSDNWNWSISGPSLICTSGTFTVNNPPDGTTVTWNKSDNLTEDPYEEGTFTANGSGRGWVEATLTTTGCGDITLPRKNIWVGTEEATVFSPFDLNQNAYNWYLTTGTPFEFRASLKHPSDDPADYVWTVWDQQQQIMTLCPSGTGGYFVASHEGYYTVNLKFNNGCGWGDIKSQDFHFIQSGSLMLQISPNPTSGETIVSIEPEVTQGESLKSASTETTFDETTEWDIEVYDSMQSLKLKKQKLRGKSTRINTQSWKEGVYMVRVKYNDEILTGKLIVKK